MVWREQVSTTQSYGLNFQPRTTLLRKHQSECVCLSYLAFVVPPNYHSCLFWSWLLFSDFDTFLQTLLENISLPTQAFILYHSFRKMGKKYWTWQDTMDAFCASVMHSALVSRQIGLEVQASKGLSLSICSVQDQNFRWHKLEWLWQSHLLLSH